MWTWMGDYDEKGKCVLWWSGDSRCVFAGSFRLFIIILCGGLGLGSFVCKGVEEDGKLSSVRFWLHVTEVYAPENLLSHLRESLIIKLCMQPFLCMTNFLAGFQPLKT